MLVVFYHVCLGLLALCVLLSVPCCGLMLFRAVCLRLVTLASGQAAGRLLQYEPDAPAVAAQTAYGIEAEVEGYDQAYDADLMVFMDYRRHHTGLWSGGARSLEQGEGRYDASSEILSVGSGRAGSCELFRRPWGEGSLVFLAPLVLAAHPG